VKKYLFRDVSVKVVSVCMTMCLLAFAFVFACGFGDETAPIYHNPTSKVCSTPINFTGSPTINGETIVGTTGSASITTLGTITTGVWQGTAVAVNKGGTGATTKGAALSALGVARGASSAMTSGAVTVLTTAVEANSIILLTERLASGIRPMGSVAVDSATAGYGFSITSSSASDTAVVDLAIFTP
jgi:hypothetical protein